MATVTASGVLQGVELDQEMKHIYDMQVIAEVASHDAACKANALIKRGQVESQNYRLDCKNRCVVKKARRKRNTQ